jgi:hypothetical protein
MRISRGRDRRNGGRKKEERKAEDSEASGTVIVHQLQLSSIWRIPKNSAKTSQFVLKYLTST